MSDFYEHARSESAQRQVQRAGTTALLIAEYLLCAGSAATASWVAHFAEARPESSETAKLRLRDPLYLSRVRREVLHNVVDRLHHRCLGTLDFARLAEISLLQGG